MIFITGDCHADWSKFSTDSFPEQKEMTRDDYVIVCGDFGVWHPDNTEKWWFRWLSEKNFTLGFDKPQWAATPGQSAVLYQGDVCLGGGFIDTVKH